jgi:putative spermidine/putrescine transport system ATP-binding protein
VSSAYLNISNVSKTYGDVRAVSDVSLHIEKGEFVTFLGPSGSGKTTTLTMIAGFEHPSSGEIQLNGRDLTSLPPWRRNIGMVFQNYALFPHMSVEKNVGYPLRMRGVDRVQMTKKVGAVLDLVGLGSLGHRLPRELSGGQQQRVAIARGLVFNPDVLLLDEPLGALDKNLREQMQVELKRIHRESGTTMVYVTHDQTEAMTMSDRIAVFQNGRIEQIGKPLDIYHRPESRFVGEFVGDSNFFKGSRNGGRSSLSIDELGEIQISESKISHVPGCSEFDVLVRPERLVLIDPPNGKTDLNQIRMTVSAVVNYGESVVVIGLSGSQPVRLRIGGGARIPAEGTMVTVGWRPEDAHLIPRRSGATPR